MIKTLLIFATVQILRLEPFECIYAEESKENIFLDYSKYFDNDTFQPIYDKDKYSLEQLELLKKQICSNPTNNVRKILHDKGEIFEKTEFGMSVALKFKNNDRIFNMFSFWHYIKKTELTEINDSGVKIEMRRILNHIKPASFENHIKEKKIQNDKFQRSFYDAVEAQINEKDKNFFDSNYRSFSNIFQEFYLRFANEIATKKENNTGLSKIPYYAQSFVQCYFDKNLNIYVEEIQYSPSLEDLRNHCQEKLGRLIGDEIDIESKIKMYIKIIFEILHFHVEKNTINCRFTLNDFKLDLNFDPTNIFFTELKNEFNDKNCPITKQNLFYFAPEFVSYKVNLIYSTLFDNEKIYSFNAGMLLISNELSKNFWDEISQKYKPDLIPGDDVYQHDNKIKSNLQNAQLIANDFLKYFSTKLLDFDKKEISDQKYAFYQRYIYEILFMLIKDDYKKRISLQRAISCFYIVEKIRKNNFWPMRIYGSDKFSMYDVNKQLEEKVKEIEIVPVLKEKNKSNLVINLEELKIEIDNDFKLAKKLI